MKLSRQLFLLSLLTLVIPWAGYQHLQEMDQLLRDGQSRALLAQAKAVATVLGKDKNLELFPAHNALSGEAGFFAPLQKGQTVLDGYGGDWPSWRSGPVYQVGEAPFRARWRLMLQRAEQETFANRKRLRSPHNRIFVFVEVQKPELGYYHPGKNGLANGDHLILQSASTSFALSTSSPGKVIARFQNGEKISTEHRIQGWWRENSNGYQVELQMPLSFLSGRFNLSVVSDTGETLNLWPSDSQAPRLVQQLEGLDEELSHFQQEGLRLSLSGTQGELLADLHSDVANSARYFPEANKLHPFKAWIYQRLLQSQQLEVIEEWQNIGWYFGDELSQALAGSASERWYQGSGQLKVRASAPIRSPNGQVLGAVIAEQSNDTQAALLNSALLNLLLYSSLGSLLLGAALLAYASWLGWRIKKLSQAAEQALDEYGRPKPEQGLLPASDAKDELGDLSRNYHQLLRRLRAYSDYLGSLSSKLSHELRTPLAVVKTSLDNLQQCELNQEQQSYSQRALQGSERLSAILNAMGAASQVEAAIASAEKEHFALDQLLKDLSLAYGDTFAKQCHIKLDLSIEGQISYWGAPELLAQALDKLVENAVDFCPQAGTITLSLAAHDRGLTLSVDNDGPLLPDLVSEQLFDSLVSVRDKSDSERPHLGLGLRIVQLIAEFHHANVKAQNRADLGGVVFSLELPNRRRPDEPPLSTK
ncbi:ATP-binding protein [uncultured Pseudoteredinibacter sp.]|uniref:ATP-binding protein n=1 Tax=uncultured Pseudoteredinibacter sp. TaxID=1641701 RepID=UPI00261C2E95|nr:ATP-binding protein [uncultured Pseudoteredinibacter sp.]